MTSPAPAAPGLKPFAAMLRREFAGYFRTPLAYVFLAVFNAFAVSLAFFVGGLYESGVASLDRFFLYHPWLWAFLAPAAGARQRPRRRISSMPAEPKAPARSSSKTP